MYIFSLYYNIVLHEITLHLPMSIVKTNGRATEGTAVHADESKLGRLPKDVFDIEPIKKSV